MVTPKDTNVATSSLSLFSLLLLFSFCSLFLLFSSSLFFVFALLLVPKKKPKRRTSIEKTKTQGDNNTNPNICLISLYLATPSPFLNTKLFLLLSFPSFLLLLLLLLLFCSFFPLLYFASRTFLLFLSLERSSGAKKR